MDIARDIKRGKERVYGSVIVKLLRHTRDMKSK